MPNCQHGRWHDTCFRCRVQVPRPLQYVAGCPPVNDLTPTRVLPHPSAVVAHRGTKRATLTQGGRRG